MNFMEFYFTYHMLFQAKHYCVLKQSIGIFKLLKSLTFRYMIIDEMMGGGNYPWNLKVCMFTLKIV